MRDPYSRPARRSLQRFAATALAASLAAALPAAAVAKPPVDGWATGSAPYVALQPGVAGSVVPLINSGETAFGTMFEGIPDGIGAVGVPGRGAVDLYVAHEQSHVPFMGFSDFQDSTVSRVRVDIASRTITELEEVLPASAGFVRFCSAFMAGPEHGFPHHTFLLNEESNDVLEVPAGAVYGSDPSLTPYRQAGYSVFLDTKTGDYDVIAGAGRHNHENTVIVPGWNRGRHGIVSLSGDDTFTFPSTAARPNLSQLYLFHSKNARKFVKDEGTLYAFRVTATHAGAVDPADPQNDANDYLEIAPGQTWQGEFIPVPEAIARGDTSDKRPQDALEDWSNDNNVFQFIRVEDIAYDPDEPRVVFVADTGNTRLLEDATTGRLWRASSSTPGITSSPGRIFRMEMNASDPLKVDAFEVLLEASEIGMRAPDNIDAGRTSLMVQEDASNAKIWQHVIGTNVWNHVATATQEPAETSGIVDVSRWFGAGWWALDVQSHINLTVSDPLVWGGPGGPPAGETYRERREDGQLLLMHIEGS